jgi:hypothetical protein
MMIIAIRPSPQRRQLASVLVAFQIIRQHKHVVLVAGQQFLPEQVAQRHPHQPLVQMVPSSATTGATMRRGVPKILDVAQEQGALKQQQQQQQQQQTRQQFPKTKDDDHDEVDDVTLDFGFSRQLRPKTERGKSSKTTSDAEGCSTVKKGSKNASKECTSTTPPGSNNIDEDDTTPMPTASVGSGNNTPSPTPGPRTPVPTTTTSPPSLAEGTLPPTNESPGTVDDEPTTVPTQTFGPTVIPTKTIQPTQTFPPTTESPGSVEDEPTVMPTETPTQTFAPTIMPTDTSQPTQRDFPTFLPTTSIEAKGDCCNETSVNFDSSGNPYGVFVGVVNDAFGYSIKISYSPGGIKTQYPELECGHDTLLQPIVKPGELVWVEILDEPVGDCEAHGNVSLTFQVMAGKNRTEGVWAYLWDNFPSTDQADMNFVCPDPIPCPSTLAPTIPSPGG